MKNESEPGCFTRKVMARLRSRIDRLLLKNVDNWLIREVIHYLKRVLKRLEVSSRSMFALVEPGSCSLAFCSNWPLRRIAPIC